MEHHETIQLWIGFAALSIELLAVAIIVLSILYGTARYLYQIMTRRRTVENYEEYKHRIARALLLGLEILVAADVVTTVALDTGLESVIILGLLVLIRTFLSWSLVVEIEERWPWQPRNDARRSGTREPEL